MLRVHPNAMLRRMQPTLRMAHLVVGAIAVVAFLVTGMLMNGHEPPVVDDGLGRAPAVQFAAHLPDVPPGS